MILRDGLKKIVRRLPNLQLGDKSNPPEAFACGKCGLSGRWFWLNSEGEDFFPSRWIQHLCLCEIIRSIADRLNFALNQQDILQREIEDNRVTRKYSKRKIDLMYLVLDDLEIYIGNRKPLLKELNEFKALPDPNDGYYRNRLSLARKYNAWFELFDCKDEEETLEALNVLYEDGSDRFLEDLEKIKKEFVGKEAKNGKDRR